MCNYSAKQKNVKKFKFEKMTQCFYSGSGRNWDYLYQFKGAEVEV
jgi:hypothetical protein